MPDLRTPFQMDALPSTIKKPQEAKLPSQKIISEIRHLRFKTLKRAILAILLIVLAAFVGDSWIKTYESGTLTINSIVSTILFIAFFPIVTLSQRWHISIFINFVAGSFLIAPFLITKRFSSDVIFLWIIESILILWAGISTIFANNELIHFKMKVLTRGFSALIVALSVLFTGILYLNISQAQKDNIAVAFISEEGIESLLRISSPIIQKFIPGFQEKMTIEEYADLIINANKEKFLMELKDEPIYKSLPDIQKRQIEAELLSRQKNQILSNISDMIKKKVDPKTSISSFVYEFINYKFWGLPEKTRQLSIIGWLVIIFSTVWIMGTFLKPLIVIVSWIMLQFLLGIRILEIEREMVERKYITVA
jgi:hypothetical protein